MRKRIATLAATALLAAGVGASAADALPKEGSGVKAPPDRVIVDPPVDPGGDTKPPTVVVDCYDPVEHHLAPCPTSDHDPEPEGDHGHDAGGHDRAVVRAGPSTRAPSVVVAPTFTG